NRCPRFPMRPKHLAPIEAPGSDVLLDPCPRLRRFLPDGFPQDPGRVQGPAGRVAREQLSLHEVSEIVRDVVQPPERGRGELRAPHAALPLQLLLPTFPLHQGSVERPTDTPLGTSRP